MNIYSKLLLGAAAVAMAACSSDEPEVAGGNNPATGNEEGTTLYLSVNITNANDARANADAGEGDLVFGDADEHKINRADFLFFDADGNFASRANVWSGSDETEAPNIEYMGRHTLTLRGLTKEQLPSYVITVLNAPAEFSEKVQNLELNMEQTRMEQFNIMTSTTIDDKKKNLFVMSTTSFLGGDEKRYDDKHYYATKLQPEDFLTEVPTAAEALAKKVDIYVERLAAKFTIEGFNGKTTFPVELTIAGMENGEDNDDGLISGATTVYVKINGFGLSGQEPTSYISKNIDGFKATDLWSNWNIASLFRSYWAKSVNYDNNAGLSYATFAECNNDPSEPIYGTETTKDLLHIRTGAKNSLIGSRVTNILITATVCSDEAGNEPLNLVQYAGVYFTYPQFKKYVLSKLQNSGKLQYWTNETATTTEVEIPVEGGINKVTTTTYAYDPLNENDFEWADGGAAGVTGDIILVYKGTNPLYKKGADYKEGDRLVAATVAEVNAELANFDTLSHAIAFNGGAMFYSVPVEHLLGQNKQKDYTVDAEGEYGIVRNHWYNITVNKVMSLGHGVFNPEGMGGQEEGEELIPDEEKTDRYALSTRINILSWKIVKQNVTL